MLLSRPMNNLVLNRIYLGGQVIESSNGSLFNLRNNGSQLKNPDVSAAFFILSLNILILNSQYVEGAKYVRFLLLTPII